MYENRSNKFTKVQRSLMKRKKSFVFNNKSFISFLKGGKEELLCRRNITLKTMYCIFTHVFKQKRIPKNKQMSNFVDPIFYL